MIKKHGVIILWILMGILSRVIPHAANFSPLLALSLMAGFLFPGWSAYLLMLVVWLVSDLALAWVLNDPVIGTWSIFTYSGMVLLVLLGQIRVSKKISAVLLSALMGSFFYWCWTNFGVWLTSNSYEHTHLGLAQCFMAAVPFLPNQMISTLLWVGILWVFGKKMPLKDHNSLMIKGV